MYNESNTESFIVFRIANYLFALPIWDVLQVVSCPPQTSRELSQVGLLQLGDHMIRMVDLQRQCNSEDFSQLPGSQPFLVIVRDPNGEFCGIPLYEPPNLIEFSREKMRSLPQSQSQSGVLKIASHAAVLSWQEVTTTVFLLDVQRALTVTPVEPIFSLQKFQPKLS
jgi:chemotaxis signal transduction protein